MIQQTSIDDLQPIIPPEEVSFWPPQPGWYVVIALLLVLLVYLIYKRIQYIKRNKYRKVATHELQKMSTAGSMDQVNSLLKATAIKGFGREAVAGLYGQSWVDFLNTSCKKVHFDPNDPRLTGAYSQENDNNNTDQASFLQNANRWIKHHKKK